MSCSRTQLFRKLSRKIHFVANGVVAFDAKFTLGLSETIFAFGQSLQNVP